MKCLTSTTSPRMIHWARKWKELKIRIPSPAIFTSTSFQCGWTLCRIQVKPTWPCPPTGARPALMWTPQRNTEGFWAVIPPPHLTRRSHSWEEGRRRTASLASSDGGTDTTEMHLYRVCASQGAPELPHTRGCRPFSQGFWRGGWSADKDDSPLNVERRRLTRLCAELDALPAPVQAGLGGRNIKSPQEAAAATVTMEPRLHSKHDVKTLHVCHHVNLNHKLGGSKELWRRFKDGKCDSSERRTGKAVGRPQPCVQICHFGARWARD